MPHLRPLRRPLTPLAAARRAATVLGVALATATAAAPTARAQDPARIPDCTEAVVMTSFAGYVDCIGAYDQRPPVQNAGLVDYLNTFFGEYGSWAYLGSSESWWDTLFSNNPQTSTGTLLFDTPLSGVWAIALKSGTGSSVYVYDFGTPTSGVPFSTAGTSLNPQDMPQGLSHANLFQPGDMTVVPEPSTYLLLATGMAGVAVAARRRRRA